MYSLGPFKHARNVIWLRVLAVHTADDDALYKVALRDEE